MIPRRPRRDLAERGFPDMSAALADAVAHMQGGTEAGKALATVFSVIHQGTAGAVDDQSQLSKALKQLSDTFTVAKDGGKSHGRLRLARWSTASRHCRSGDFANLI
jgi:hypothetical protein